MAYYYGCSCAACRVRSLLGPFILITIGVLFAMDHIMGRWSFGDTWPVILIVIGLVKVFERMASSEGHRGLYNPPPPPYAPPPPVSNPGGTSNAS